MITHENRPRQRRNVTVGVIAVVSFGALLVLPVVLFWVYVAIVTTIAAVSWALVEHERAVTNYSERIGLESQNKTLIDDFDRLLERHAVVCQEHANCKQAVPVVELPAGTRPGLKVVRQRTPGDAS